MKTSTKMQFGWMAEIVCFVSSGAVYFIEPFLAIILFSMGLWISLEVGDLIRQYERERNQ